VKSTDSRIYNGFKISYEAKNIGPRDLKLALKQIWDTYLGEKSGLHFITNNIARFDSETIFQGDTMVSFLVSPGESASLGLLLDQLARPDLVIVANWKRLADSVWSYETLTRGFSLSPYSINDSALGLYWNEIILKSGDSHVFTHYLLSGGEGQEFVKNLKTGVTIANEPVITPDPATSSSKGKLLLDIQELKTLLVSLEAVIGSVDTVKNESVQSLLDRLTALEASLGSTK